MSTKPGLSEPSAGTRACSGIADSRLPPCGGFPGALQLDGKAQRLVLRNPWLRASPCPASWFSAWQWTGSALATPPWWRQEGSLAMPKQAIVK
ncbi:uncharacterized protein LOC120503593 isoform X2 [Passer montanus]|uniref:uncharacterized protein LOC120503593 isoform X2 n=1 Tax=Passer montanus TaxID=9160 RepID=UPI001961FE21|nr:uncharacterized protein LOC120503593 isoform X2 [Passer montanus]